MKIAFSSLLFSRLLVAASTWLLSTWFSRLRFTKAKKERKKERKKQRTWPVSYTKSLVVFLFGRVRLTLLNGENAPIQTTLYGCLCSSWLSTDVFHCCHFHCVFSSSFPCRIWWCGWQRSTPRSLRRAKKSSSRKDRSEPRSVFRRRRRRRRPLLRWRTAAASRTASTATPHRPFRPPKATPTRSSIAVNWLAHHLWFFFLDFEEGETRSGPRWPFLISFFLDCHLLCLPRKLSLSLNSLGSPLCLFITIFIER